MFLYKILFFSSKQIYLFQACVLKQITDCGKKSFKFRKFLHAILKFINQKKLSKLENSRVEIL